MGEFEDRLNSILGDPEQMDKIANLAKSLMGGEQGAPAAENSAGDSLNSMLGSFMGTDGGIDAAAIGRISRLMNSASAQNNEKQALFNAMKPYLSEKRRAKMDKAIKIAGLARIARLAMGEMGDKDV